MKFNLYAAYTIHWPTFVVVLILDAIFFVCIKEGVAAVVVVWYTFMDTTIE